MPVERFFPKFEMPPQTSYLRLVDWRSFLNGPFSERKTLFFRRHRAGGNIAVPDTSTTTIGLGGAGPDFDTTGGLVSHAGGVLTVGTDCIAQVMAGTEWAHAPGASGLATSRLVHNGSTTIARDSSELGAVIRGQALGTGWQFSSGDTVQLEVFQNTGSSRDVLAGEATFISMALDLV